MIMPKDPTGRALREDGHIDNFLYPHNLTGINANTSQGNYRGRLKERSRVGGQRHVSVRWESYFGTDIGSIQERHNMILSDEERARAKAYNISFMGQNLSNFA